jgi:NAD(P)-dependent dehydrogenase (short-subunit alcohol dehydrogenase family)
MSLDRRTAIAATAAAAATVAALGRGAALAQTAPRVLITGANRGIGLEFAKQYAARGWNVIATARNPSGAEWLQPVAAANTNVTIEPLDVTDQAAIKALAAKYAGQPIDVLINNAGVTGDFRDPRAPQNLGSLDGSIFDEFMRVNALGPLMVTEAFLPNVKASAQKKIVTITSLMGSFGAQFGTVPGNALLFYKMSKTAVNAGMANLASALKGEGVIVTLLSPGTVRVEKVADQPARPGLLETPESVGGLIAQIDALTVADAGTIVTWDGQRRPF